MSIIDLGLGRPADDHLPYAEFQRAARETYAVTPADFLQYAPEPGSHGLREALALFLRQHNNSTISPDELLVTSGASHGLDLVLSQFTAPGDVVLVEDPSYFYALEILARRGVRVIPVSMDDQGIDLTHLDRQATRYRPKLLYCIPTFHNPTGTVMSTARRQGLIDTARRHNLLLVADDVYQLLNPSAEPYPLRTWGPECVISLGSFSKILAPGLRLGWIEATSQHRDQLLGCGVLRSGGGISPPTCALVEWFIRQGEQQRILQGYRRLAGDRLEISVETLSRHLPDSVQFVAPTGGYFTWLVCATATDCEKLRETARGYGVDYRAGNLFSCHQHFRHALRLCHMYYPEPVLREGLERLVRFLRDVIP